MTTVDRSPAPLSSVLAVGLALLAAVTAATASALGFAAGVLGVAVLAGGVAGGRQGTVSMGALLVLTGVLYAGVLGAPAAAVLLGVVAAAVAWDLGGYAIGVGVQLGRAANTRRLEVVHAAASLGVGLAAAGVGYGVFLLGGGGQPLAALLALLVAVVLVAWALSTE